jgi:3-dehydroquinate synthase
MVVRVDLGARSYDIVVEPGALGSVGPRLRALGVGSRAAVISDQPIRRLYGKPVADSLDEAGFSVTAVDVPEGESAKSLAVAEECWNALLDAGLDRTSTVLALGGGAVGDVAGFVAGTYMRGVNFVQLPTTVLAQVDASSGGKTAIDHPKAKNLIGVFHQPRLVLVDPLTAGTLPEREFRSGLAEIVKHGVVLEAAYFAEVEAHATGLLARETATLVRIVAGSCRLKATVVERDEREAALRAVLNYGHTVGHALEAASGYGRWTHGEAVSLGMVAEARLAERLGLAAHDVTERQERLLVALGLPVRTGPIDVDAVLAAMRRDKKSRDGIVPFVLAPRIGEFRIVSDVPAGQVRAALEGMQRGDGHGR